MALFGAPRAHDDDPIRAARAALDIHEAMARCMGSLARPPQAHVGIANGEVVAGVVRRGEAATILWLETSTNLAARLVAVAAPGETLLSEVKARFDRSGAVASVTLLESFSLRASRLPVRAGRLSGISGETAPVINLSGICRPGG